MDTFSTARYPTLQQRKNTYNSARKRHNERQSFISVKRPVCSQPEPHVRDGARVRAFDLERLKGLGETGPRGDGCVDGGEGGDG